MNGIKVMTRIFSIINSIRFFTNNSPYNSSYTKIGDLIEKGDVKKLQEISDSRYHRTNSSKLEIQSVNNKEKKVA